jgi:hypothetical protein
MKVVVDCHHRRGEHRLAERKAAEMLELLARHPGGAEAPIYFEFVRARARWEAGRGRKMALADARRARDAYAATSDHAGLEELDAWLRLASVASTSR